MSKFSCFDVCLLYRLDFSSTRNRCLALYQAENECWAMVVLRASQKCLQCILHMWTKQEVRNYSILGLVEIGYLYIYVKLTSYSLMLQHRNSDNSDAQRVFVKMLHFVYHMNWELHYHGVGICSAVYQQQPAMPPPRPGATPVLPTATGTSFNLSSVNNGHIENGYHIDSFEYQQDFIMTGRLVCLGWRFVLACIIMFQLSIRL